MQGAQMGRPEDNPAEGLMTAVDVARHLLKACPSLRLFEPFMFGSSLRGVVSDFDSRRPVRRTARSTEAGVEAGGCGATAGCSVSAARGS